MLRLHTLALAVLLSSCSRAITRIYTPHTHTLHTHALNTQVSQHDAEALSWAVHLPRELRARVLALRAFSLEVLMIGEAVKSKELAMAAIR